MGDGIQKDGHLNGRLFQVRKKCKEKLIENYWRGYEGSIVYKGFS